jgi:hypothetical protein
MARSTADPAEPRDLPRDDKRAVYYRVRADECFHLAQLSSNQDMRDQWLRLANQWTSLLLHNRQALPPLDD